MVQKTSTLILQVFADVVDTRTDALLAFRGDTDEAWLRMEHFLAEQLADAPRRQPGRPQPPGAKTTMM